VVRTAVVIAAWEGHPASHLEALLDSMDAHAAGAPFDLILAVNGADYAVPDAGRFAKVLHRENVGFNLGAWDHAWRSTDHDRYLFLQDECTVRRASWLAAFAERFDSTPGLIGEHDNRGWDRAWFELVGLSDARGERARRYHATLEGWGVDPGATARHLTTVVHYSSREVLDAVGGYRVVSKKDDAIAAEIGFSRAVVAAGYALAQVGRHRHSWIAHPQWPSEDLASKIARKLDGWRGR